MAHTPYVFYTMDNVSGSTLVDEQGNLNGAITGATQVSGHIGQALDFTGTSTEVQSTPHPGLTDDIAISFFCKFDVVGSSANYYPLVTLSNNVASTGIGLVRTYNGARVHMGKSRVGALGSLDIFQYNNATYGHTPSTGVWYHYFCQYNHDISQYEFWVDAVSIFVTTPSVFGSAGTQCNGISIGYGLDAQIDHVKIFDLSGGDPFTQSEIEDLRDNITFNGYFSGYVYEQGSPISRTLYLHNRDDGVLADTTTSSGNGYYYLETSSSGSHYIVCLDDEAGANYNDLIIGDIYPTTISG
jgi:hypothetical protein